MSFILRLSNKNAPINGMTTYSSKLLRENA